MLSKSTTSIVQQKLCFHNHNDAVNLPGLNIHSWMKARFIVCIDTYSCKPGDVSHKHPYLQQGNNFCTLLFSTQSRSCREKRRNPYVITAISGSIPLSSLQATFSNNPPIYPRTSSVTIKSISSPHQVFRVPNDTDLPHPRLSNRLGMHVQIPSFPFARVAEERGFLTVFAHPNIVYRYLASGFIYASQCHLTKRLDIIRPNGKQA
jgi:hypothetical protein